MAATFDEVETSRRIFESVTKQIDLARKLGLTSAAISNLKRRKKCTLDLILAAAELTGKSVEWFLFGERAPAESGPHAEARALERAVHETSRKCADLGQRLAVAEEQAPYGDARNLRKLLHLCEQRIAALEEWARVLGRRLAALEQTGKDETLP